MTSQSPTGLEGQVDATNPIEIFWEKNRRTVLLVVAAVVLALGTKVAYEAYQRSKIDATWTGFLSATGLDESYSEPIGTDQMALFLRIGKLSAIPSLDDEQRADLTEISEGSDTTAAWSLWVLAMDARRTGNFSEALRLLDQITVRFPDHLLATETAHPPQWLEREPVLDDDGVEIPASEVEAKDRVYAEPVTGSPVSLVRAQIERQQSFASEANRFYEVPAAGSAKVAVLHFEHDGGIFSGDVRVRFYQSTAPNNVAAFMRLVEGGFFDGMSVHRRRVSPEGRPQLSQGSFDFGWPTSREESLDDWLPPTKDSLEEAAGEELKDSLAVEWEDSGAPLDEMMLAVTVGNDGKTKLNEVSITAADEVVAKGTQRLVLGQVVGGQDLVREIVENAGFQESSSLASGEGKPADRIQITSIEIEDA